MLNRTAQAIDLGIVVTDADAALKFYRDTLGFVHEGEMPMPGGGLMHRTRCGDSLIKLVKPGREPGAKAAPGGLAGAYGLRYWTIHISNLDEVIKRCRDGGYAIAVEPVEFRPGLRIAIVEDPDGNWVEFAEAS